MQDICCKWASSLGELEATHQEVWGTKDYVYLRDKNKPTVFFGLYDFRDYFSLSDHRGKSWVLWAGGDLENLVSGFAFNDGKLRWLSRLTAGLFTWWLKRMLKKAEHWVEDEDEFDKLERFGIKAKICPSFLGDIKKWTDDNACYYHVERPGVYVSCAKGRQIEYGFGLVEKIAKFLPYVKFHLYGDDWKTQQPNIIVHGRVSKEQFNKDIRHYQCGLRLNEHDGFSEITAKSILMGQYPITYLKYPMIPNFDNNTDLISLLASLRGCSQPNKKGKEYYINHLNQYPWNLKK